MKKEIDKDKALERLERLCSRSEQCEFDLNRKMVSWGLSSSDRKEVLESLKENRFVDDTRFAKSFSNDKARFSFWGPAKIRMELIRKRIKSQIITVAIQNVEQKIWKDGILHCASIKAQNLDLIGEESWENQQKLFRYLISRGFPPSAVSKVVNLMKKHQAEESDD